MIATNGTFDNLSNAPQELDVIKIVKEYVLRILCERSKKTLLEVIKDEIKVAHLIISKAIEELRCMLQNDFNQIRPFLMYEARSNKSL